LECAEIFRSLVMKNTDAQQSKHTLLNIIDKTLATLKRLNIYILVLGPLILSLLLLGLLLFVGDRIYEDNTPEVYQAVSGVVFLFIASFSGFFQIYRREGPGPLGYPIFGIWPIINGCLITIICWASILYLITRIYNLIKA